MSSVATLNQVHFRVRTDTGTTIESTPTWGAAEDTNWSVGVETMFRLRFVVQNTGTAAGTNPMVLRVSKNGGAYTAVTTSSGATLGAQAADASTDADNATFPTRRLTAGAGSYFTVGVYDENGSAALALSAGMYTEVEYGLILKTAGAAAGNTFDFRCYNNTTAFTTYGVTPRVTVPTVHAPLANDISSASSVTHPAVQQLHGILANDVASASSVGQPALGGAVKVASMMHNYRMRRA